MISLKKPLDIDYVKTDKFLMAKLHFHDFYEIYFPTVDGVEYIVNDFHYQLKKHDLVILNRYDLHRAVAPKITTYERYTILFEPSFIEDISFEQEDLLACFEKRSLFFEHKIHLNDDEAKEFINLINKKDFSNFPIISQKIKLCEILMFVNERFKPVLSDVRINKKSLDFEKIEPAIKYINDNISESLLLDELAKISFMEKSYFCKKFKQITGFTVHEYISFKRVITAEKLLLEGKSVMEVSQLVGYQSSTHFSTKFKEYWNMSPKQFVKYKKTAQNDYYF